MSGNGQIRLGVEWNPSERKEVTGKPVIFDLETSLIIFAPSRVSKGATLEILNLIDMHPEKEIAR